LFIIYFKIFSFFFFNREFYTLISLFYNNNLILFDIRWYTVIYDDDIRRCTVIMRLVIRWLYVDYTVIMKKKKIDSWITLKNSYCLIVLIVKKKKKKIFFWWWWENKCYYTIFIWYFHNVNVLCQFKTNILSFQY
jgi:hypothetical protein